MGSSSRILSVPPPESSMAPANVSASKFFFASRPNSAGVDTQPLRAANASTTSNPMLCRVPEYSLPGLPRPTTSFIHVARAASPCLQPQATHTGRMPVLPRLLRLRSLRGLVFRLAADDFRFGGVALGGRGG